MLKFISNGLRNQWGICSEGACSSEEDLSLKPYNLIEYSALLLVEKFLVLVLVLGDTRGFVD